ncbi:MAG TPA: FAD-binding oxidoreductase [Gemmatirosa sp.]
MADLIVVGAGIVGASVAYHAAARGGVVTLVDRGRPGSGVTGDSFAWVGGAGDTPGPAAALRGASAGDYRRLEAELEEVRVTWSGSLSWGDDWPSHPAGVAGGAALGPALGPGTVLVDAGAVAALEPNLRAPPPWAVHAPDDGAVDPVAVTNALVRGARDHGATVRLATAVHGVHVARGRVAGVETSAGVLHAGTVVLATGVDIARLCAPLGVTVPVAPSPAVLVRCAAPAGLVRTLVSTPAVEVRQGAGGVLLAAVDYEGESTPEALARTAHRTLGRIAATFRRADGVRVRGARVGLRPMPADGAPVIGPAPTVPGLYLAVMHAGVALAPTVGRLIAAELVGGRSADALCDCRPARFSPGEW